MIRALSSASSRWPPAASWPMRSASSATPSTRGSGSSTGRGAAPVDELLAKDAQARRLRAAVEQARADQRRASAAIRGAPTDAERDALGAVKRRIQEDDARLHELENAIETLLLEIPNPPHDSVP